MAAPGSPPPSSIAALRSSGLRVAVSFGSLSMGQVLLGERDSAAIVRRASVGAALAETTAQFLAYAQREGNLSRPMDPLLLAGYGERELEKIWLLVQAARLHQRVP